MKYLLKYIQSHNSEVFEDFKSLEDAKRFCNSLVSVGISAKNIKLYKLEEVDWNG